MYNDMTTLKKKELISVPIICRLALLITDDTASVIDEILSVNVYTIKQFIGTLINFFS